MTVTTDQSQWLLTARLLGLWIQPRSRRVVFYARRGLEAGWRTIASKWSHQTCSIIHNSEFEMAARSIIFMPEEDYTTKTIVYNINIFVNEILNMF